MTNTRRETVIYNIPELNNERKLANYITNSFIAKGIECKEETVNLILDRLNLKEKRLSKDDLKKVAEILYKLNEKKKQPVTVVEYPVEEQIQSPSVLTEHPIQQPITDESGMVEPDTKLVSTVLIIDSRDRNTDKWNTPNPFDILFGYPSKTNQGDADKYKGYIEQTIGNIYSIELLEVIIPAKTIGGDNLANYPYILLDIEEFGGNFVGSNQTLNKSFAKLSQLKLNGNYLYYRKNKCNEDYNKRIFSPRISLNKMTLVLRAPDVTIISIQPFIDEHKKKKSQVVYTFNVKSYKRTLDTLYIY